MVEREAEKVGEAIVMRGQRGRLGLADAVSARSMRYLDLDIGSVAIPLKWAHGLHCGRIVNVEVRQLKLESSVEMDVTVRQTCTV